MYKCPYCNTELEYDDYFGFREGWNKLLNEPKISNEGDIYKCTNDKCLSEAFNYYFYDFCDGILMEGYPC
jgi:hypothetical protein